jgi:hypothetical protein
MLPTKRLTPILLVVFLLLATLFIYNSGDSIVSSISRQQQQPSLSPPSPQQPAVKTKPAPILAHPPPVVATAPSGAISYDKSTPPSVGCEALVHDLQARVISTYQQQLRGIRYANIFGYLGVLLSLLPFAFSSFPSELTAPRKKPRTRAMQRSGARSRSS